MQGKIDLRPSRLDWVLYGLLHVPTLLLLLVSAPAKPLWLLLLPFAGYLAWRHYCALGDTPLWLMPPTNQQLDQAAARRMAHARATNRIAIAHWQLCDRDGERHTAELQAAFLYPWLTVVDFKLKQGSRRLLLWPDNLSHEAARRLRRLCLLGCDTQRLS